MSPAGVSVPLGAIGRGLRLGGGGGSGVPVVFIQEAIASAAALDFRVGMVGSGVASESVGGFSVSPLTLPSSLFSFLEKEKGSVGGSVGV
jgi:hypothetical protein